MNTATWTLSTSIDQLAALILEETKRRIATQYSQAQADRETVTVKPGRVYTKIDRSGSGMLMIENATGDVFGIKGYGQVHKGHKYGHVTTIEDWYWGEYYPRPATEAEKAARTTTDYFIDTTPKPVSAPEFSVGDGATMHIGSDASAWTVIAVSESGKTITIQRDNAVLSEDWHPDFIPGGFVGHTANNWSQTYVYSPDPEGVTRKARLTQRGWSSNGFPVSAGRREFYDYNF